jgi:hypothetical protein
VGFVCIYRVGQFDPDKALSSSLRRWPSSAEVIVMGNASQWVLIKRLAEITGYSENAVRHKIKGGVWIEGRIWRKAPDGRIFVNLGEFERWVESDALVKAF